MNVIVVYAVIIDYNVNVLKMSQLKDDDLMPFGKYAGKYMWDVPGSYLLWLEEKIKHKAPNKRSLQEKYLLEYIEDNKKELQKEADEEKKENRAGN